MFVFVISVIFVHYFVHVLLIIVYRPTIRFVGVGIFIVSFIKLNGLFTIILPYCLPP